MPPTQVWQPMLVASTQPAKLRVTTIRRKLVIPVPPLSAVRALPTRLAGQHLLLNSIGWELGKPSTNLSNLPITRDVIPKGPVMMWRPGNLGRHE